MEAVFLKVLNMGIAAGWLILAVIVLRTLLKRAPKAFRCVLWAFVGIRLLCPFSLETTWSLIPSGETLPSNILTGNSFRVDTGFSAVDTPVNDYLGDHCFEGGTAPAGHGGRVMTALAVLWLAGAAAMLLYAVFSYLRLRKNVREAMRLRDHLWICDGVQSPFILGVVRPRIYLPSDLDEARLAPMIAHENAHLKRRDHWWKPLGFVLLSVYWFHPLVWAAYVLFCRDIELACDEKVVRNMEPDGKKAYSEALLCCSAARRMASVCPLAFGEVGVKERIRNIVKYKKAVPLLTVAAAAVCIGVVLFFLTDPVRLPVELEGPLSEAILSENTSKYKKGEFACEDHVILGVDSEAIPDSGERVTVYAMVLCREYSLVDGTVKEISGFHGPVALTFEVDPGGAVELTEYWTPGDGSMYASSVREKFPMRTWLGALDPQTYIKRQQKSCDEQAHRYFGDDTDPGVAFAVRTIPLLDGKTCYDLTAEKKLEIPASQAGQYQLYTNSTRISVKLSRHNGPVAVYLFDTEYPEDPILQFGPEAGENKVNFTGLTASRNYFLTVEAEEELTVTVSD